MPAVLALATAALATLAALAVTGCAVAPGRDSDGAGLASAAGREPVAGEDARAGAPRLTDLPGARPAAPSTARPPAAPPVAATPPLPPPPAVAGPHGELVRAGTRVVTTTDLGDFVLRWEPDVAAAALRRLRQAALVESEASRERVEVPAALVEAAAGRAVEERLRRIRIEHGARGDTDEILHRVYGRTAAGLREDFRRAVRIDLLRQRLARLEELRRDGVDLRILVLPDERTANSVAAQWRDGADAGLLARKLGVRPPAAPPAVAIEDVPDARLRARLAAALPGDVLPPAPHDLDDPDRPGEVVTCWQVLKVVRAWRGSALSWSELADAVEASLQDAPAAEEELAAWDVRAGRRAGVAAWDPVKGFGTSPPGGTMPSR